MAKKYVDYEKILEIIIAFNGETDYYNLLEVILTKIMEFTNADGGTLYVRDGDKLYFRIIRTNSQNKYISAREENSLPPILLDENNIKNVSAYSALKNEVIVIDDVYESTAFNFEGPKKYDKMTGYRTQSMCVLPLSTSNDHDTAVIGVIQLLNATSPETGKVVPFTNVLDPPILPAIASASANVLANILYTQEIKELFHSLIRVMAKTIDERTPYNKNHTVNVAYYCEHFADFLSKRFPDENSPLHFSDNRQEELVMAAMLHDIGKITTPLRVMDKADRLANRMETVEYKFFIKSQQLQIDLLKGDITNEAYEADCAYLQDSFALIRRVNIAGYLPDADLAAIQKLCTLTYRDQNGIETSLLTEYELEALSVRKGTLTDTERRIMQEHVSVTARLLDEMRFPNYYAHIPLWAAGHHEYLDGSGYPDGLSGEAVTVEMSILAIADVFDALTASDRPYKKATPIPKALEILDSMAGEGKFPQELVDLFKESNAWA